MCAGVSPAFRADSARPGWASLLGPFRACRFNRLNVSFWECLLANPIDCYSHVQHEFPYLQGRIIFLKALRCVIHVWRALADKFLMFLHVMFLVRIGEC